MKTSYNKRTSWFAVVSLVCLGIASLSVFLFIVSVFLPTEDVGHFLGGAMIFFPLSFVLGVISIIHIIVRRKQVKGYIISILAIVLSVPPIWVINEARLMAEVRKEREKNYTGIYNLRRIGEELVRYANNNNGYLPDADKWCDLLLKHNPSLTKDIFKHPLNPVYGPPPKSLLHPDFEKAVQRVNPSFKLKPIEFNLEGECNFAFNKNVSGLRLEEIAPNTVLIWEANGDWNLNGGPDLLKTKRGKQGYIEVLLVDQNMVSYLFAYEAYRTFESGQMHYNQLQWKP